MNRLADVKDPDEFSGKVLYSQIVCHIEINGKLANIAVTFPKPILQAYLPKVDIWIESDEPKIVAKQTDYRTTTGKEKNNGE